MRSFHITRIAVNREAFLILKTLEQSRFIAVKRKLPVASSLNAVEKRPRGAERDARDVIGRGLDLRVVCWWFCPVLQVRKVRDSSGVSSVAADRLKTVRDLFPAGS